MRSVTRDDQATAPANLAIINVKACGEFRYEEFNNIHPFREVSFGVGRMASSDRVGVFYGWDGELRGITPGSFHSCLSNQSTNRTRPTVVDSAAKYGSLHAALLALVDKEPGAMPESRRKDDNLTASLAGTPRRVTRRQPQGGIRGSGQHA